MIENSLLWSDLKDTVLQWIEILKSYYKIMVLIDILMGILLFKSKTYNIFIEMKIVNSIIGGNCSELTRAEA